MDEQGHFTITQIIDLFKTAYEEDLKRGGEWDSDKIENLETVVENQIISESSIETHREQEGETYYKKTS
jgi:hypothetical protein